MTASIERTAGSVGLPLETHVDTGRASGHLAPNYDPLPIVVAEAEGSWVTDVDGRRYLDCLAGYSALNCGARGV